LQLRAPSQTHHALVRQDESDPAATESKAKYSKTDEWDERFVAGHALDRTSEEQHRRSTPPGISSSRSKLTVLIGNRSGATVGDLNFKVPYREATAKAACGRTACGRTETVKVRPI
jgi:hypothetical protein